MNEQQPYLHDKVSLIAAPLQYWSQADGDITANGIGLSYADINLVGELRVTSDGVSPTPVGCRVDGGTATFTSVLRHLQDETRDGADPHVILTRHRALVGSGVVETFTIESYLDLPLATVVMVEVAPTATPVDEVKHGRSISAPVEIVNGIARWGGAGVAAQLTAELAALTTGADGLLRIERVLQIPAGGQATMTVAIGVSATRAATPTIAATASPFPASNSAAAGRTGDPRLMRWLTQSVTDLDSLRLEHRDVPGRPFFAAGAPWYLTLFGRDSVWTARLAREVSPETATGTVEVLAAFQGRTHDPETEEAPGKIIHELRSDAFSTLPSKYYGTIDATSLWVCLLVELWRDNQLDHADRWLPAVHAALAWITGPYADPDGDGFLEYIRPAGARGLANQGWKDSTDAIRFADGTMAEGPIALSEAQGYAFQAVTGGVEFLRDCGAQVHQDAAQRHRAWAVRLKERFAEQFLLHDGLPALALDRAKQRVDATTSNIGHLLGTGILEPDQQQRIADRLLEPDMCSGLGLRTMSSSAGGYNPFSYHCGSVWAHDTAIAIRGMSKSGLHRQAGQLARQLLAAAEQFDYRLPELWSGHGDRVIAYPAACRPQAWAAAAALPAIHALTPPPQNG